MNFSEASLRRLCKQAPLGDFPPFSNADESGIEAYIKTITGRLKSQHQLVIDADFNHYGSGYSSYVPVRVYLKNQQNNISWVGKKKTEWIDGLLIYICRLAPYWYYGATSWTNDYNEKEERIGGMTSFLELDNYDQVDENIWAATLADITNIMTEYRYALLTPEELEPALWFDVDIPTCLGDKPYQVFDCFFYWED